MIDHEIEERQRQQYAASVAHLAEYREKKRLNQEDRSELGRAIVEMIIQVAAFLAAFLIILWAGGVI